MYMTVQKNIVCSIDKQIHSLNVPWAEGTKVPFGSMGIFNNYTVIAYTFKRAIKIHTILLDLITCELYLNEFIKNNK